MGNNIDRARQSHNRITHNLSGAMPSYFATAINVNNWCSVNGTLMYFGPLTGGVYRCVLKQKHGVRASPGNNVSVNGSLNIPARLVIDAGAEVNNLKC
jgi:hypothetical protein